MTNQVPTLEDIHSGFSDLYKDVYGFRPRGHRFYDSETTDKERQEIWLATEKTLELNMIQEAQEEQERVEDFKQLIQKTIDLGASNEDEALKWLTQNENFYHSQDVDHFVWEYGILFTPYGKEITEKLYDIVEYTS